MKFEVKNMDLFTVPQGYCLAHCISADFALGAGIAKKFDEIYNMRERLFVLIDRMTVNKDNVLAGSVFKVDNVFNLVTKINCFDKPTYDSFISTLNTLKKMAVEDKVKKLAMPKIGCGLDKLDWNIVEPIIKGVFMDTDIEVLICDYNPENEWTIVDDEDDCDCDEDYDNSCDQYI